MEEEPPKKRAKRRAPEPVWVVNVKVLGIIDGAHDSGACLVQDGTIVAAVGEERLTRVKLTGGFPRESIRSVLEIAATAPEDVDLVAVGSVLTPQIYFRMFRPLQRIARLDGGLFGTTEDSWRTRVADFIQFRSGVTALTPGSLVGRMEVPLMRALVRRDLPATLRSKPIRFVEHHLSHGAGAYYTSGKETALCITCDGIGDGTALAVFLGSRGRMRRLHAVAYPDSLGLLYATVTGFAGFAPFRHEGKLTGLAAYGNAQAVDIPFPFERRGEGIAYTGRWGLAGNPFFRKLMVHRVEDVAAWLQEGVEEHLVALVEEWVRKTGVRDLCLSGGVFANVRLNHRIHASGLVDSVYVFPHMGDGGLCAGGALHAWAEETVRRGAEPMPHALEHVFLGPEFDESRMERALQSARLVYHRSPDIEREVAELVAAGRIVGRVAGRMEFGPRALGNRSILCSAASPDVKETLNRKLRRTEFMPFAPCTRQEDASACYRGLAGAEHTAQFMNISFECTDLMRDASPGAVHVDRSARPQIVRSTNPSLHRLLSEHARITGLPSLINTSFNVHEEPIVCTPEDAVRTFESGGLDALALGPFLARRVDC